MSLLRRSVLSSRALLDGRRSLASSVPPSTQGDELPDGEFRRLELYKKQEARRFRRNEFKIDVSQERYERMPVDQDWPSVWPVAASFKPSAVPLPVRQGYFEHGRAPPGKRANLELMKIPNFLHLTPPAVERHCQAINKFCTAWPDELTDERSANWVTVTTSDYVHSGPSIRDERARIVTVRVRLAALDLDDHARDKLLRLVGDRYNPKTDELTIVTDRCPFRRQNLDYSMYVLTALFHESWITEDWELTERQEADMPAFEFDKSRSQKYVSDYAARAKSVSDASLAAYGESISQLKNQGDNEYNLDDYKRAVCAVMNLQPPPQATVQAAATATQPPPQA